jgi:cytochrome P450
VFVNARGESTGAYILRVIFYLIQNSWHMERAQGEVIKAFKSIKDITKGLFKPPYLNAVNEETLRIYPPTPGLFARRMRTA